MSVPVLPTAFQNKYEEWCQHCRESVNTGC